ncbi:MAG: zf-HC2 domain-containing protein [Candidatus Limivicinus sp.]
MKTECDVIRDLLPLYADDACSQQSRALVEEHLDECPVCSNMLQRLKEDEIESSLLEEKESVISYAVRRFRRRSAAVGSAVSGAVLIPILIALALMFIGPRMSWVSVTLAALCVPAALIAVPLLVPEDKFFWTFCAFTASLLLLLGVTCIYTRGDWFWIASAGVLFGLSVIFLPFLLRAKPLQKLIGNTNRWLIVIGVDLALFVNLLNMISTRGHLTLNSLLFSLGVIGGIGFVIYGIARKTGAVK